jgi:CSLREA domain-containing protein
MCACSRRLHAAIIGLALTFAPPTDVLALGFTVNSTVDAIDVNPGDGLCATATAVCSLRAAIQETNARAGDDTITLPAGVYTLTIAGAGEEAAAAGDLEITSNLTIQGVGNPVIDGNGTILFDRVFHITGPFVVSIVGVDVRGGRAELSAGGGIFVAGAAALTLTNTSVIWT